MEEVKEFIFSLMIVSLSCAAVNMLAPDNSETSKYVHFLVALVVTVVLISPVKSVVKALPSLAGYDIGEVTAAVSQDNIYAQNIIDETVNSLKTKIYDSILQKFKTKAGAVDIEYNADDIENVIIDKINIYFEKENRLLFSDVEKYITSLMGCECEVFCLNEE